MKIEGAVIRTVKGRVRRIPVKPDEEAIRRACRNLLKNAREQRRTSCVLPPLGVEEGFIPLACAKIMAQEILRHLREAKTTLKNIRIVLPSQALLKIFDRGVNKYLDHVVNDLSKGPYVTVDAVIEVRGGVVLIQRSNPPLGWALPGGFVDPTEALEKAAAREAREETGLCVKNLQQMYTYSDPARDPRFPTISTVFVCQAQGRPRAGSDARQAGIFREPEWRKLKLVFDHRKVLADYLKRKKAVKE